MSREHSWPGMRMCGSNLVIHVHPQSYENYFDTGVVNAASACRDGVLTQVLASAAEYAAVRSTPSGSAKPKDAQNLIEIKGLKIAYQDRQVGCLSTAPIARSHFCPNSDSRPNKLDYSRRRQMAAFGP